MTRAGIVCVFLLMSATALSADVVELQGGEKLVGKVVRWEGGKLTFNSNVLGMVKIPVEKIQNLQSDEPLTIELKNGEVLKRRIERFEETDLVVTEEGRAKRIAQSDLISLNPRPPIKWSGSFDAGLTVSTGNTSEKSGNFSADATRETKKTDYQAKTRWRSKALYLFKATKDEDTGEDVTNEENVTVSSKYDYFFNDKLYGFANGSWKKDHIADLDRRVIVGVGSGYEWINDGTCLFTTDAGLAFRHEKYITRDETQIPPPTVEDTNDEMSAQLGYLFHWTINHRFSFLHDLTYYPSFSQVSDYFLNSTAEVRLNLEKNWFTSFKTVLDYNATPPEDTDTTDLKYILSLGWSF